MYQVAWKYIFHLFLLLLFSVKLITLLLCHNFSSFWERAIAWVGTSEWPWLHAACCLVESIFCRFYGIWRIRPPAWVFDEMVFTCGSSKLIDGNESKSTNSANRISANGCASRIYSSAASWLSGNGRVTFRVTYVFVFILLCVWEGTVTGSI